MSAPSTSKQPARVRIIAWAVSKAHPASLLPTLDPDGLYASSIVQARRGARAAYDQVEFELQAPSTLLHDALPCLEDAQSGVIVADSLKTIESFSWKFAGRHGERSILHEGAQQGASTSAFRHADSVSADSRREWANAKALEQFVLANMHPLIHQTLFAKTLFRAHTAQVYASGLGIMARRSVPNRIRRNLQTLFAARGMNMDTRSELGPILREDNTTEAIEREEREERESLITRAGFSMPKQRRSTAAGLLSEEKQEAGRAFGKARVVAFAEQVFNVLAQALGSNEYLSGHDRPSLLDLRVFSLLAPLLLPVNVYPALAASPLPTLLRSSFPALVEHTERVRIAVWPTRTANRLDGSTTIETPDWPLLPGRNERIVSPDSSDLSSSSDPLSIRIATSLGRMTSSVYIFSTRLASRITTPSPSQRTNVASSASNAAKSNMTAAELREARMVQLGKYAWIATSLVVAVGTAVASGILRFEIQDEEDDEVAIEEADEGDSVTDAEESGSTEEQDEDEIEVEIETDDEGEEELENEEEAEFDVDEFDLDDEE